MAEEVNEKEDNSMIGLLKAMMSSDGGSKDSSGMLLPLLMAMMNNNKKEDSPRIDPMMLFMMAQNNRQPQPVNNNNDMLMYMLLMNNGKSGSDLSLKDLLPLLTSNNKHDENPIMTKMIEAMVTKMINGDDKKGDSEVLNYLKQKDELEEKIAQREKGQQDTLTAVTQEMQKNNRELINRVMMTFQNVNEPPVSKNPTDLLREEARKIEDMKDAISSLYRAITPEEAKAMGIPEKEPRGGDISADEIINIGQKIAKAAPTFWNTFNELKGNPVKKAPERNTPRFNKVMPEPENTHEDVDEYLDSFISDTEDKYGHSFIDQDTGKYITIDEYRQMLDESPDAVDTIRGLMADSKRRYIEEQKRKPKKPEIENNGDEEVPDSTEVNNEDTATDSKDYDLSDNVDANSTDNDEA